MFRTLIVDDNQYARQAVRDVLEADGHFDVVGMAASAEAALADAVALHPDLVLMDVRMPGLGGIAATARLKARLDQCRVVMLTVSEDVCDLFDAIRHGAQGYLLKNLDPEQWSAYLLQVMSGEAPISREIASRILHYFADANPVAETSAFDELTSREEDVLQLVCAGCTNREIAQRLRIAESTVKNHLQHILGKLHLHNRTALASLAARTAHGLPVDLPRGGHRRV